MPNLRRPRIEPELAIAVIIAAVLQSTYSAWVADDALISMRYARHLGAGHGLVWNPGEAPVEGYSNFLHVVLGALAVLAGFDPLAILRPIGWLATLALVVLVHRYLRRLVDGRVIPGAAAFLLASHTAWAYWAGSGLETALYSALLFAGIRLVVLSSSSRRRWAAAPLLLASLARPEGAAMTLLLAVLAVRGAVLDARRDGTSIAVAIRADLQWIVPFGATYGAYFIWRWAHFGHLFPNPIYYKAASDEPGTLAVAFASHNLILLVFAALAPVRRHGNAALVPAAIVVGHLLMLWNTVPSVAGLHRFFMPAIPCVVVLAGLGFDRVAKRFPASQRTTVVVTASVLTYGWSAVHDQVGLRAAWTKMHRMAARARARVETAEFIASTVAKTARVAVADVGIVGYLHHGPIDDLFGLNSYEFTRDLDRRRKPWVRGIVATRPDVVVLNSRTAKTLDPVYRTDEHANSSPGFARDYVLARRVLSPREDYHYFVYLRRDHASGLRSQSRTPYQSVRPTTLIDATRERLESTKLRQR